MSEYSASSIRVLKDLEPVKERPGMYTRTTCPTHIVQEVIDNAADEALAGFAKKISVAIRADGVIEVSDNGRGLGRERIVRKAIERGLLAEGTVLTDPEVWQVILCAWFWY